MSSDDDLPPNATYDLGPSLYKLVDKLDTCVDVNSREIGSQAVWSVSSCKQGYGVGLLRDGNLDTYWQSDGTQPHTVNIQFRQKTDIDCVAIYTDYKTDESYTPSKLSFRAGNHIHDLKELEFNNHHRPMHLSWHIYMQEPSGWVVMKLRDKFEGKPVRAFFLQIVVLLNHQNGRDTHLRQIKVFSAPTVRNSINSNLEAGLFPLQFSTVEFSMYSTIR